MNAMSPAQPAHPLPLERLLLEREMQQVLIAYALLCDGRDWRGIGNVFSDDDSATYGGRALPDRAAILAMLRNNLGGCGPTQHLPGNLQVWGEGAQVPSRSEVRARHRRAGEEQGAAAEAGRRERRQRGDARQAGRE